MFFNKLVAWFRLRLRVIRAPCINDVIKAAKKAGFDIDKKNPIRETKIEGDKFICILNVKPQEIIIKGEFYE